MQVCSQASFFAIRIPHNNHLLLETFAMSESLENEHHKTTSGISLCKEAKVHRASSRGAKRIPFASSKVKSTVLPSLAGGAECTTLRGAKRTPRDAILQHFAQEGVAIDAQEPGGLLEVGMGLHERFEDMSFFGFA